MKYWHFTYWQNDYAILKFDFPAQLTFLPDVTSFFVGWSRYTKSARRRRVFSPAPEYFLMFCYILCYFLMRVMGHHRPLLTLNSSVLSLIWSGTAYFVVNYKYFPTWRPRSTSESKNVCNPFWRQTTSLEAQNVHIFPFVNLHDMFLRL